MRQALLASGASFAHLLGRGNAAKTKAEDDDKDKEDDDKDKKDDKKDKDDEDDDDKKAVTDDEDDAEDEKDDKTAATDDEDKDAASRGKSRKAKKDEDEEDEDAKASAIRGRERARCAAIFATTAAAKRPDIAAHLAFGTNLSAGAAINTLKAVVSGEMQMATAPPDRRAELRNRMAQQPSYDVGTETEQKPQTGPQAFAAQMLLADQKRRGLA